MDLLNSLSSARKEIEERRYSRFRGSNISISPEPPQANSPKPPMPRNHFKKITEKPNDFGVLHRSISQTKLDMHKRVTSPTGNMTTRLKINDIHLDLSRIYDSSVRSPTRNRIRDYKIDAAKLLVSSISNSVINRFRTFRKNTEILGNYSKNRYGASINYDLGVNRSLDHTVRRSERDFTGKIVRKKDEL